MDKTNDQPVQCDWGKTRVDRKLAAKQIIHLIEENDRLREQVRALQLQLKQSNNTND